MRALLVVALFLTPTLTSCAKSPRESSEDVAARLERTAGSHVYKLTPPSTDKSGGTGFVVRTPSGAVTMTNAHVCHAAEDGLLVAHRDDGSRAVIKIIRVYQEHDLCALEAVPGDAGLQVARRYSEVPGTRVWAIGYPLLRPLTTAWGVVSLLHDIDVMDTHTPPEECHGGGRHVEIIDSFFGPLEVCIRTLPGVDTTMVIYGGNSGSPVLNEQGQIVGVVYAGDGRSNWGVYVPYEALANFVASLTGAA